MNDQEKRGPGRPKNIDFNQDHIEKEDLENIFSTVPAGYAIQVHRDEPEWCKGYCGKIFVSSDEPINLDMLKNKYGGTVLTLRFVNAQSKFKGSKRIIFPDPPKRDGRVIREGDLLGNGESKPDNPHPGSGGFIPPGMPPQLAAQLAAFYAGYPIQQQQDRRDPLEAMQATQIMNMMNAQMQSQQELMKQNMNHMREMERIRRDSEEERDRRRRQYDKDRPEPMGGLQNTISIIRELNGIKGELGATDTTAEIISHSAPIVQDAIAELIDLQKMKIQAEMARSARGAPPLPPRNTQPTVHHTTPVRQTVSPPEKEGNGKTDPVELATQLRAAYDGLTSEQQTAVMSAFLNGDESLEQTEQNLDHIDPEIQNIEENTDQLLSDEDKELLDEQNGDSDQIQDGEHSGTAEENDPAYRSSDSERSELPADQTPSSDGGN